MRRILAILFLLPLLGAASFGSIITNDNTALVFFASSYDTYTYHYFGDYVSSWVSLAQPQYTNHWYSASRSGGSLEDANEDRLERLGLAHWAEGKRAIGIIMADDAGGYSSNDVRIQLTNTFKAPQLLFNGSAYTNEGGWASTNTVTWIGVGAIPHDSLDGDSGEWARNDAVLQMCADYGLQGVDMWHTLWTGGWGADATNGTHLTGFYTGSHPYASGSVTMGIVLASALAGADTNVSLATVDWNATAVVSTNHCVISGVSRSGNVLTFTRHDDRLPMAWDVPDGFITNDCRNGFVAVPQFSNAFWFTIAITNLPAGNYKVSIDGSQITTLSASALATGWNMFASDYSSQYWRQRVKVLSLVRLKDGADPVTLIDHSAGEGGPSGLDLVNYASWSRQFWLDPTIRGDSLISSIHFISADLNGIDKQIHDAAQPTNHIFTITRVSQTITFPSPGDQTYGVGPITLNATASSGLPVSYSIISGPATVSGNTLTITGAGSVTVQASQAGDSNWPAATPVTQVINVAPKTAAAAITAAGKTYDGTSNATIVSSNLTGIINGDVVILSGGVAAFPDKTVGSNRTVTATGLSLTGPNAGNYTLTSTSAIATADVTSASLTVSGVTSTDKIYNGNTVAFVSTNNAVLIGAIGSDVVGLNGAAFGSFSDPNVATGKSVTISGLTLAGPDAGNYTLVQPLTVASIVPANTSITASSSISPAPPGSNITFTAVVNALPPGGGMPTGTITFQEGETVLGTSTLNGSSATLDIATLSQGSHTITVGYSGDGNFFSSTTNLSQIIQAPLVAGAIALQRYPTGGAKIRSEALLTNAVDAAGNAVTLVSAGTTSADGGTVGMNGGWVYYEPPANFTNSDSFTYVISDSAGLQATGSVTVSIFVDANISQNPAPDEEVIHHNSTSLQFLGIPQRTYTIQYTTNLVNWQSLGTATADSTGLILFSDSPPSGSEPRTYRTTYP